MGIQSITSMILAVFLIIFFRVFEGWQPPLGYDLAAIVAVSISSFVYLAIQLIPAFQTNAMTPVGFAIETATSNLPAYVLVSVGTLALSGHLAMSGFGWMTFGIVTVVVALDVLGLSAAIAKRLELTSDFSMRS